VYAATVPTDDESLWDQPSFLVALALGVLWLAALLSSSKAAQAGRPGFAILLIVTVLGYLGYRRVRGLRALRKSNWLPRRQTTRRRKVALGIYLAVLAVASAGLAVSPALPNTPVLWTKNLDATTCGDWQSVMTDYQRNQIALTLLDYDRLLTPVPADAGAGATSGDYVETITLLCSEVGPSANLFQSWEAGNPGP